MIETGELHKTVELFKICAPLFVALGDSVRQQLVLDMANAGPGGMNVTDLTSKTHLSRPAISHHLKVLKDCGLIMSRREGTQIFYYIHLKKNIEDIKALAFAIEHIVQTIDEADSRNLEKTQ